MEVIETDRINIIAEKRKWQMEMENKRRQLEDDKRALQHLKSKALRERWLLDGVPSGGLEHEEVKRQLQQDEERTRALEDTITRLERELVVLESGGGPTITPAPTVLTETVTEVEVLQVKESDKPAVVSSVTVVHEMNGEDGGHILSSSEVEELIHKADEASMKSQTVSTITKTTTASDITTTTTMVTKQLQRESDETKAITGLEAKPEKEASVSEATEDNPVTMVFMGYQNVEDEDETKRVLGLKGTVKAELVVIEEVEGKTSPVEQRAVEKFAEKSVEKSAEKSVPKAATPAAEKVPKEKEKSPEKENGETAVSAVEERAGETEEGEKKKQPFCLKPLL